jgi:hypothetical protein
MVDVPTKKKARPKQSQNFPQPARKIDEFKNLMPGAGPQFLKTVCGPDHVFDGVAGPTRGWCAAAR